MVEKLNSELSELSKRNRPALSGWPMFVFWWAMILFAIHASTHMVGAGDTWVAMACGRHFINHGVDTVEPFSANSHHDGPTEAEIEKWPDWAKKITNVVGIDTVRYWHPTGWVNQNWLTHVIFYWLTHDSPFADAETFDRPIEEQNISYNSLVYWKYALYIITVIVVYYTGRSLGVNPALSATAACFALFVGRTFFDIRPAGYSNMLTAVLLFIYVLAVNRNYLYIWLIVPLMVFWCNVHGGYIYIFLTLIPLISFHFLQIVPKKASLTMLFCGGWLFFGLLAKKFWGHPYLDNIDAPSNALFYLIALAIIGRVAMTFAGQIKSAAIAAYDLIASAVIIIVAANWLYPAKIANFIKRDTIFAAHVGDERLTFLIAVIGFIVAAVLLSRFRGSLKTLSFKGWTHTVAAAIAAFVASIVFNPFHLTNLTHTFIVTVSEDAKLWKTVNEWHPAFEWKNPVGDEIPFLIMYIIMWVLLAGWIATMLLRPKTVAKGSRRPVSEENNDNGQFVWPKIDLPLMVIAAMTVYMAIGSRRFIPVAAIAACPLMAMFFVDTIRIASVVPRRNRKIIIYMASVIVCLLVFCGTVVWSLVPQFPKYVQWMLFFAAVIIEIAFLTIWRKNGWSVIQKILMWCVVVVVVFLTVWWGYWYKAIYLNPWPDSNSLSSEFMRMSASYAKPFKTCQFIRDNKLSGKMFNYWTEGGFLAYGQNPDPNTGQTPLQLFMDGRAQAAYDTKVYKRWMKIMSGGTVAEMVNRAKRKFTASDYRDIGNWLSEVLRKDDVWVVVMPKNQFNSRFVRGLDAVPGDWRIAFMNDSQRIYVDIKSKKGIKLFVDAINGKAIFPDEYSKNLTIGYYLLRSGRAEDLANGFERVKRAFEIQPSYISTYQLFTAAGRDKKLRPQVIGLVREYLDEFLADRKEFRAKDGYRDSLTAATLACDFLIKTNRSDKEAVEKYKNYIQEFNAEQRLLSERSRW